MVCLFGGLQGVTMQCYHHSIMDKFGRSFETMTDNYDTTTGVIKREKSKLKVTDNIIMLLHNIYQCCFSLLKLKHILVRLICRAYISGKSPMNMLQLLRVYHYMCLLNYITVSLWPKMFLQLGNLQLHI